MPVDTFNNYWTCIYFRLYFKGPSRFSEIMPPLLGKSDKRCEDQGTTLTCLNDILVVRKKSLLSIDIVLSFLVRCGLGRNPKLRFHIQINNALGKAPLCSHLYMYWVNSYLPLFSGILYIKMNCYIFGVLLDKLIFIIQI